ncbi:MAG: prepilin-type N-terminal cleavage/methylation domain-containing protein [Planctomycetota bacterium]|nr:prepilin-type N-terminal cleavage/methylation domain-containing protein [Planctomycetota bacterium]
MRIHSAFRIPHSAFRRGLTLVELMITMAIFIVLALALMAMMRESIRVWSQNESSRLLYERAAGGMDRVAADLALTLSSEPAGVDEVRVRLIGDIDPQTGQQRLMFVRSFEAGPERALTLTAGDGKPNVLRLQPFDEDGKTEAPPPSGPADRDVYTGRGVGDYMALGGMAQIAYFADGEVLYRGVRAPAVGRFTDLVNPATATPLVQDCLFLGFDYWGMFTTTWKEQPPRSRIRGPEKIWDSTRGINVHPLNKFIYARPPKLLSENDPSDDIFPRMIRVTCTVDAPLPGAVHTKLFEELGADDGMIYVEDTRGFPPGGAESSYIKIGKEWIHYKERREDAFVADERGARGTVRADHAAESVVRVGRTFSRIVFIPGFREDDTPDEVFEQRKFSDTGKQQRRQ